MRKMFGSVVLVTVSVVASQVMFVAPAQAIACNHNQEISGTTIITKTKTCVSWGGNASGARIYDPYSSYLYYNRFSSGNNITASLTLKDTNGSDGRCAYVRVRKQYSAWNFDTYPYSACGKDTTRAVSFYWSDINMAEGWLSVSVCAGQGDANCNVIWGENVTPG